MKEYVPIFVSIIAGVFAVGSAIFTWNLKQSSEKRIRELSKEDKVYSESKSLYIKIHEIFEDLIKETRAHDKSNLNSRFSKLTAEVGILAPQELISKYQKVADLYQE